MITVTFAIGALLVLLGARLAWWSVRVLGPLWQVCRVRPRTIAG